MGNSKFVKDSFITLTRQLMSIIIGMLLISILARSLGPDGQGHFSTLILLPVMLMNFLNMGINSSTVYYVSKKETDVNSAFKNNLIFGMILSLIGIFIGSIVVFFFSDSYFQGMNPYLLLIILIALPFMIFNIFLQTIFQGMQNFKLFNTVLVMSQFSNLIFVCILVAALKLGLVGATIAYILGHVITFIYILIVFKRKYKIDFLGAKFSSEYFKKSIRYGIKAHISNVVTILNYRVSLMILIYFFGPAAVGIYTVAVDLSERLSILSQSISSVLLPKVASINNNNERNQLTSVVSRNIFVIMIVGAVLAIALSDILTAIFFGSQFKDSSLLLKILLPGIALLSIEKILSNDIAGRGKPEINMYVSIFNICLNVIISLILIPTYGVIGAAIATTATYSVSFIVKVIIYRKFTGMNVSQFLVLQKNDYLLYKQLFSRIHTVLKRS